jgi:predicted glycoside hydrolase/deacetylase ChbG (UPF0249 family)
MLINIIVNADDFGYSNKINNATIDLISKGLISSTSILANGKSLKQGLKLLQKYENISTGIHLNLSEGTPVNENSMLNLNMLIDGNSCFNRKNLSNLSLINTLSVYREWCAQIDKLLDLGVTISHIDSHHHVHTLPKVFIALKMIQYKYKINSIRSMRNTPNTHLRGYPYSSFVTFKKLIWKTVLIYLPPMARSTYLFGSIKDIIENNINFNSVVGCNAIEMSIHPGHNDNLNFKLECDFLLKEGLAKDTYNLISYNQLEK